ncbi:MAG TPA: hypothetical protein VHM25_01945, partial [Polyangiaceae bacterium]|nr:hypothetical protein [Polyangiaceae bacterium]
MLKKLICLVACAASSLTPAPVRAQTAVLLAVADAAQLSEVKLAKVMADDASLWLAVQLKGGTRLALVTAEAGIEVAPAADAWLRALDYSTRVRVAAPPGSPVKCGDLQQFEPDDTGLPEAQRVAAFEVSSASTELELRRRLADAGLPVDAERVAQFTSVTQPPFRVALYDVPMAGGSTEALRWVEQGQPTSLPQIAISGAPTAALGLIAIAGQGVQLLSQDSADPSEFPVVYRAIDASSDYLTARRDWLAQNPTRWLNEVQAIAPLFSGTVMPSGRRITSLISRYFTASRQASASACEAKVRAAYERASTNADDFTCDAADDLARSLSEIGFAELRASRFFGRIGGDGANFRGAAAGSRSPLLFATDLDLSGCPADVLPPVSVPITRMPPAPVNTTPVVVSTPDDPYTEPTPPVRVGVYSEGSCTGSASDPGPSESCSGDTSSTESSSDSCSGDTSSTESSSDSCSGDTSSTESSSDSCSGDTSSTESSSDSCSGDTSSTESSSDSCSGDTSSTESSS